MGQAKQYDVKYKEQAVKLAEEKGCKAASRQRSAKKERMKFIALKTDDGKSTGHISFFCRVLEVTRQGFYEYLKNRDKPWKYENLAAEMMEILKEDECNNTYT